MDWNTYYSMLSNYGNFGNGYNNWNYQNLMMQNPMMQNLNMPIWNFPQSGYYGYSQSPNFQGQTTTTTAKKQEATTTEQKSEPKKAYIAVSENGTIGKPAKIYEGTPEKIAEYQEKYKSKKRNRKIAEVGVFLGSIALAVFAGPKIAKALKLKPGSWFGDMASDNKVIKYITSGITGAGIGGLSAAIIDESNGWKKDLRDKYFSEAAYDVNKEGTLSFNKTA